MTAYIQKKRKTPQIKLRTRGGWRITRSLGTTDKKLGAKLEAFVKRMIANRRWDVIDLLEDRTWSIIDAYEFDVSGTVNEEIKAIQARREAAELEANEVDLSPLVDQLLVNDKYRSQVRRLIPVGEKFPISLFSRSTVSKFLNSLTKVDRSGKDTMVPASNSTKNRYKAALSVFAKRLIEREIIDRNVVREVESAALEGRTISFLEPVEVRLLVEALPMPNRALEAFMAGTGMEWQAVLRLRKRDIDTSTRLIYAQGTKTVYRTRYVEVTEDWAWQIIEDYIRPYLPDAILFDVRPEVALEQHYATSKAKNIKRTTLHQHRHSYAVMWIRRGLLGARDKQWLKNQLGHGPASTQIDTVYGVYINAAKLTHAQEQQLHQKARVSK